MEKIGLFREEFYLNPVTPQAGKFFPATKVKPFTGFTFFRMFFSPKLLYLDKPMLFSMGEFDTRITAYIDKAPDFARPVLTHLRKIIHEADPDIVEAIKWGHVHFDHNGPLCYMTAHKQHCRFGFWKTSLMPDPEGLFKGEESEGLLTRLTAVADLPADEVLIWYIRNALDLNLQGVKKAKPKAVKKELTVPDDFENLLASNPEAKAYFNTFSYTHRKEYIQWITEAKTEATRQKRMEAAVELISVGKPKNWKYQS